MSDHAPILLRPHLALADAMTAAAEASGCSRQTWMLTVLADAVTELGHYPTGVGPDDVPLFVEVPCRCAEQGGHVLGCYNGYDS